MKIEMRKITNDSKQFSLNFSGEDCEVVFCGSIFRLSNGLIKIEANIAGSVNLICDVSGDEFSKKIDDKVSFLASDGIWDTQNHINNDDFDVFEFFDGYVDLESILKSELESIKLDYHSKD